MSRLWQDAASILETASSSSDQSSASDFAILIDHNNGLRMLMNAEGWRLDTLQNEYGAAAAYTVKRTAQSVTVEAQDGQSRCILSKSIPGSLPFSRMHGLPQHLIRLPQARIA